MLRVVVLLALASVIPAHAETRGTVRFGVLPLELEATNDTPLFGDDIMRALGRYNAAAAAYESFSGTSMRRLDARDVDLVETMYLVAPGIEFGGERFYLRLEAPVGLSDDLTAIGIGIYPINLKARFPTGHVGYVSVGGAASWLDRPGSGDVGGLLMGRAAVGIRFARYLSFELGVNAFAIGGSINNERLDHLMNTNPEDLTRADLRTRPEDLVSAGEARGLVDVSVGVTF